MNDDPRLAEKVLYIERARLEEQGGLGHGFSTDEAGLYPLINREGSFLARAELEEDPARKQAIPYVVVHDNDGRVFTMGRKRTQTEARLHGKLSFGIGGHIPDDIARERDRLDAGMRRELHEELHISESVVPIYRGILNDDTNAVGRVHMGLVFTCLADPDEVSVRERDKMSGEWLTLDTLESRRERVERWADFLLEDGPTGVTS